MGSRTWLPALAAVILAATFAASIVGPFAPAEEASVSVEPPDGATPPVAPWTRGAHAAAWFRVAAGAPGLASTVVEGCDRFVLDAPPGTARLELALRAQLVNASRPGAGSASFELAHDEASWSSSTQLAGPATLALDDPPPGPYAVWVFPDALVVDQVFELALVVAGSGPAPADVPLGGVHFDGSPCEQAV